MLSSAGLVEQTAERFVSMHALRTLSLRSGCASPLRSKLETQRDHEDPARASSTRASLFAPHGVALSMALLPQSRQVHGGGLLLSEVLRSALELGSQGVEHRSGAVMGRECSTHELARWLTSRARGAASLLLPQRLRNPSAQRRAHHEHAASYGHRLRGGQRHSVCVRFGRSLSFCDGSSCRETSVEAWAWVVVNPNSLVSLGNSRTTSLSTVCAADVDRPLGLGRDMRLRVSDKSAVS